ncbi:hypothetical protein ACLB2K_051245 [Fragaria x ananassa]
MDFILPNILDHDGELSQIACVPCVEHKIRENHVHPLPPPLGPPSHQKDSKDHVHLMIPRQIDFSQPKRKASITFGEIDDDQKPDQESKKVKKIMHRDIERQRRQEMTTLYASLRSHLPLEYLKGKRSISDHVHQAANYIKHLQKNLEELREKKDELKNQCNISGSSTAVVENLQTPSIMGDSVILVRPACTGVEIVVSTPLKQGLPLSRVIGILVTGLGIVSCNSAKRNQRLIYTLETEVIDGESIDIPELQNRLIEKCTSEPFVWDSIAHGKVELEMDDSTLGIRSLSVRIRVRRYSEMMRGGEQDLSEIQQAKCDYLLPEQEAIKLVIRGLEHRQRLKHHGERFSSMGDLINKVGSYELILNELDDKANASKGTYVPAKNRIVGALSMLTPTHDP